MPKNKDIPSRMSWVATPQGMPTRRAMAEGPLGNGCPYSIRVEVRLS